MNQNKIKITFLLSFLIYLFSLIIFSLIKNNKIYSYILEIIVTFQTVMIAYTCLKINKLSIKAYKDDLTDLWNKNYLYHKLNNELKKLKNSMNVLSIAIFDVDNFKRVNDTYGHITGNVILKKIASIISSNIKNTDKAIRFGGEEFIVILPDTEMENAFIICDGIRKQIENDLFDFQVTISGGIASTYKNIDSNKFIEMSDIALYNAKNTKNTIVVYNDSFKLFNYKIQDLS